MAPSARGLNVLVACVVRVVCQVDRLAWSFFVLEMAHELRWTNSEQGTVKAAFAGGYLLTQVVGGLAGDRYGNKIFQVLSTVVLCAGLCAVPLLVDALDAGQSASVASSVYFLMGLACGPQHPTGSALLKKWCLPSEKGWVSTADSMSSVLGSLVNMLLVAKMVQLLGWRHSMFVLAGVTAVVTVVFVVLADDAPRASGARYALAPDEIQLFHDAGMLEGVRGQPSRGKQPRSSRSPSPAAAAKQAAAKDGTATSQGSAARLLFGSKATWGLILGHALYNCVRYTFEQEMPKYYSEQLHMSTAEIGEHMSTLPVLGLAASFPLKIIAESASRGGLSLLSTRRVAILLGYGIVALGCAALAWGSTPTPVTITPWTVTAVLNGVWLGLAMQTFGHIGNYYDITNRNTGLLMGVGNTVRRPPPVDTYLFVVACPLYRTAEIYLSSISVFDSSRTCAPQFATVPSFLSPLVVAHIVETHGGDSWPSIFKMLAATSVGSALAYAAVVGVDVVDGSGPTVVVAAAKSAKGKQKAS